MSVNILLRKQREGESRNRSAHRAGCCATGPTLEHSFRTFRRESNGIGGAEFLRWIPIAGFLCFQVDDGIQGSYDSSPRWFALAAVFPFCRAG